MPRTRRGYQLYDSGFVPYKSGIERSFMKAFWAAFIVGLAMKIAMVLLAIFAIVWLADIAQAEEPVVTTADSGHVTELPAPAAQACPFSPGWNLVVLQGTPSLLPSCVTAVWRFEGDTEQWYFWGRDNAPYWNDLTEFDITKGYWLYAE